MIIAPPLHCFIEKSLLAGFCHFLLALCLNLRVEIMGKAEDNVDPEYKNGGENDPIVKRREAIKGNDIQSENDGCDTNAATDNDGGDEPLELHFDGSGNHNQGVIREYGKHHHKRKIDGGFGSEKRKRFFTIICAEYFNAKLVSAKTAKRIHNGA